MIMADLDPAQSMMDQSGEFPLDIADQPFDVKVQTTAFGVGQMIEVEIIRVPSEPPPEQ